VGVLDYFCCSQCVPMKFPLCWHQVFIEFLTFFSSSWFVPQCVSNSSSLSPKSFDLSSNLVIYITNPKDEITTYLFWDCWQVDFFFCDEPMKIVISYVNYYTTHIPIQ
jgi:hypothetical protein